jgi:hypothetical protein
LRFNVRKQVSNRREKNGQLYELTFKWDGERWDAEKSRKGKKRKFAKRPKPYLNNKNDE